MNAPPYWYYLTQQKAQTDTAQTDAMADDEEVDFFSMLNAASVNRMDDQRSSIAVPEAPAMLNFDLLRNEIIGGQVLTDDTQFPCNYLGHLPCHMEKDKEGLCNRLVWKFCKGKATKKSQAKSAEAFANVVRVDAKGVEFTIGNSGAAKVLIPLQQVACVSLCAKKDQGPLKIVAILCRSALHRVGKKGVGELEMMVHMCRLKDKQVMWNFQKAFVTALKTAFPTEHAQNPITAAKPTQPLPAITKPEIPLDVAPITPRREFTSDPVPLNGNGNDGGYLKVGKEKDFNPREQPDSPEEEDFFGLMDDDSKEKKEEPKKKKVFVHKVYVKSQAQTVAEDNALAKKLQRREELALANQSKQEEDDGALVRALQIEEDAKLAHRTQEKPDDDIDFDLNELDLH